MKKRLKNWITTVIGIIMMLLGIGMIVVNYFNLVEKDIPVLEIVMIMIFGWTFLFAKDSLLEGMFLSIFKIKKESNTAEGEEEG